MSTGKHVPTRPAAPLGYQLGRQPETVPGIPHPIAALAPSPTLNSLPRLGPSRSRYPLTVGGLVLAPHLGQRGLGGDRGAPARASTAEDCPLRGDERNDPAIGVGDLLVDSHATGACLHLSAVAGTMTR